MGYKNLGSHIILATLRLIRIFWSMPRFVRASSTARGQVVPIMAWLGQSQAIPAYRLLTRTLCFLPPVDARVRSVIKIQDKKNTNLQFVHALATRLMRRSSRTAGEGRGDDMMFSHDSWRGKVVDCQINIGPFILMMMMMVQKQIWSRACRSDVTTS